MQQSCKAEVNFVTQNTCCKKFLRNCYKIYPMSCHLETQKRKKNSNKNKCLSFVNIDLMECAHSLSQLISCLTALIFYKAWLCKGRKHKDSGPQKFMIQSLSYSIFLSKKYPQYFVLIYSHSQVMNIKRFPVLYYIQRI